MNRKISKSDTGKIRIKYSAKLGEMPLIQLVTEEMLVEGHKGPRDLKGLPWKAAGKSKPSEGQSYLLNTGKKSICYVYVGKGKELNLQDIRSAAVKAHTLAKALNSKRVAFSPAKGKVKLSEAEQAAAFAEGVILASFKLNYKGDKESEGAKGKSSKAKAKADGGAEGSGLQCLFLPRLDAKGKALVNEAVILAKAQNYARALANLPANIGTPERCVEEAKALAKSHGLKITIWDKAKMKKAGMNLALAVNSGSAKGVYLVHLVYTPKGKAKSKGTVAESKAKLIKVAIVGKGITFDSGGLGIKPGRYMLDMNLDKSGACVMLGIIKAASELALPIELHGIAIFTENMPGAAAYRPSDVIKGYSGKTVEIQHTDAEGRLILADALAYASKVVKPKYMLDLATLTGAMSVVLGKYAMGIFGNSVPLRRALEKAGEETYERVWPLPMYKEYGDMVKSDIADVKNIGSWDGEAGSITAAKFLEVFVGKGIEWVHIDIASMMEMDPEKYPFIGKRGAAPGVRLVTKALKHL